MELLQDEMAVGLPERTILLDGPLDGLTIKPNAIAFSFADSTTGLARWYRACDEGHWHYAGSNKLDKDGKADRYPFPGGGDWSPPCPTLREFADGADMFFAALLWSP